MSKHTPWCQSEEARSRGVGHSISNCVYCRDLQWAVPDLLEVCRALVEMANEKVTISRTHEIASLARAAIAKAEGK